MNGEKFPNVQEIRANLFLGGVWPAYLVDGKIVINLITQIFFDYEAFKGVKDKMPADLAEQLEVFYNMDWANYIPTNSVTVNIDKMVEGLTVVVKD